jgi:hypothetical protein
MMSELTRRNVTVIWLAMLTACVAFLGLDDAVSKSERATFEEIDVERINIVEPDGQYRLVLANSERFPGLFMRGKEYRHHSRSGGGMLFFNDFGDEVGGLTTGAVEENGEYSANAGLMFDQYKQDQTVGVIYSDRNGERVAGLRVWDRPDYSIEPLMEFSDRAARAATDAEKEAIRKEMLDYAMAHGGVGALRFFAGKELQDTIVRLADREGRPRLVLKVDGAGAASVEFLDADGEVVKRITAE